MARTTPASRAGRTLVVFFMTMGVIYGLVAIAGSWKPELGLDLQGGTRITLIAKDENNSSANLEEARKIIDRRVNGSGVTEAEVTTAAYWIDDTGGRHRGADGVARALEAAGGSWGMLGRVVGRPPLVWAARGVYAVVARNRHRLPGSTPACRLPRP